MADQDDEGKVELYISGIATVFGADNQKVSQPDSSSLTQVLGFQLSSNGTFAVFEVRNTLITGNTVTELFATRLKPEDEMCVPIKTVSDTLVLICL